MRKRKNHLKKATALCAAAILTATAVPSVAYAADTYADAEKSNWAESVKNFTESYAASLQEYDTLLSGSDADITLKLEDSGRSLLGFIAPFDISWLNDITFATSVTLKDGQEGVLMKALLNGTQICTIEYYLDSESQDVYMRIPELSDKYFKTNLKDAADAQTTAIEEAESSLPDDSAASAITEKVLNPDTYTWSTNLSLAMMSDFTELLPEASVVEELLNRYSTLVFDNMSEQESTTETLTAQGISEDCTVYESRVSETEALKIATAILESAKSDKEIEGILETWSQKLPDSEGLYDKFLNSVESGLASLKEADPSDDIPRKIIFIIPQFLTSLKEADPSDESETSEETDDYITSRIWVNADGLIAGRELSVHSDGTESPVITWQMPKSDSEFGYLLSYKDSDNGEFALTGSGTLDGDLLNGTYQFSANGTPYANIELQDYDTASAKKGNINGNYTVTLISSDEDDSMAALTNFALNMNLTSADTSGSIDLSITSAGSTLGTLSITSEPGDGIEIPDLTSIIDAYDVTDEDAMTEYASGLDFTALMSSLTDAGVPDEVITYILSGGSSAEDATSVTTDENTDSETTSDSLEADTEEATSNAA